jgi:hypothetical protein
VADGREARETRAGTDFIVNSSAIDLYALEHDYTYPKGVAGLVTGERKYVKDAREAAWGNDCICVPGADIQKADYRPLFTQSDGRRTLRRYNCLVNRQNGNQAKRRVSVYMCSQIVVLVTFMGGFVV